MTTKFGYNSSGSIKNFDKLHTLTQWAGGLGIVQAIIWIGLTITAIMSYNCLIPQPEIMTFGSLLGTVFVDLYFRGNCEPKNYVEYNNELLNGVPRVFNSQQILIWVCVYLGITVCWLIASTLLFTHIRKDSAQNTVITLYVWIVFTGCICAMDLVLGICFGIDYGRFNAAAYTKNFAALQGGVITELPAQLTAAATATATLMVMSFKGFVLYLINVGLMVYLLIQAIAIVNDKDGNDTLFMPRKDSDDILTTTRPPINAYDELKSNAVYTNEVFVSDTPMAASTIELNQESLARAARMSTDATLQDRRFRNLDAYQQYPPPRPYSQQQQQQPTPQQQYSNERSESYNNSVLPTSPNTTNYPAPDYSPPMNRSNAQGGILRNQRYQ